MTAYMLCQFIILFFFISPVIQHRMTLQFFCVWFQQIIYKCLIIQYSMNITSHTFLVYKTTVLSTVFQSIQRNYRHPRNRAGFSHVYFISLASFRILKKMKIHLPRHLLPLHRSNDGKQSQSRQLTDLSPLLPDRESQVPSIGIPHKFPLQ